MEDTSTTPHVPGKPKEEEEKKKEFNITNLHSQKLHIPNLWPAFSGWKRGINPLYHQVNNLKRSSNNTPKFESGDDEGESESESERAGQPPNLKAAIDTRLEHLIQNDPIKLRKAQAVDLFLFASCLFPDVKDYSTLETVAFYLIWLFFWDDAIDGTGGDGDGDDIAGTVEAGRRYRDESVAYVRYCLRGFSHGDVDGDIAPSPAPTAPTAICESFGDAARRIREHVIVEGLPGGVDNVDNVDWVKLGEFEKSLEKYMDACVVEQAWRLSTEGGVSGVPPSEEEFWGWRLGTSSVDALLDLSVILNKIDTPLRILTSEELRDMRVDINKLLVCINELFSLKKELKDNTAHMNLIPITMHASEDPSNLDAAVQKIVKDIYAYADDFQQKKESLRMSDVIHSAMDQGIPAPKALDDFDKLVAAYQVVVTGVLHFSMESPRYGILGDCLSEEGGGGFLVTL